LAMFNTAYNITSIWGFLVIYLCSAFGQNYAEGANAGLLPDITHMSQIGAASGYLGLATVAGKLIGSLSAGFLSNTVDWWPAYSVLCVLLGLFTLPTLFFIKESTVKSEIPPMTFKSFFKSLYLKWSLYKDFYFVLLTRFFQESSIYHILNFLQFFLGDVIQVANPPTTSSLLIATIVICAVPTSIGSGYFSDKYGRKTMVYIACAIQAVGMSMLIVLTYVPNLAAVYVAGGIYGLGYGMYISVDWALALDVLPDKTVVAKDMGIWHLSMVIPDIIAPFISGAIITATQTYSLTLGYAIIFSISTTYVILAGVFVWFIKPKKFTLEE